MTANVTPPSFEQIQLLYRQGDLAGAMQLTNLALNAAPQDAQLLYTRAHLALALKDYQQAAQDLDQVILQQPQNAMAYDDRGVIYQIAGDFMKAGEMHLRAAELQPHNDGILLNLGIALMQLGQRSAAEGVYQNVLALNPSNTQAMINLAVITDELGRPQEAINYLERAQTNGDTSFEMCMAMGNAQRHLQQRDKALHWYSRAVAHQPNNSSAQFMLATMRGDTPDAPPPEHISSLFDSFADTFESTLCEKLQYQVPDKLYSLLQPYLPQLKIDYHGGLYGVDLGAGTGLFGQKIREDLAFSVGIDLSAKMLEKAREKNIYDEVIVGDVVEALGLRNDHTVHVVSAADVLIYLGDLAPIFSMAAAKLVKQGLFAFTTEVIHPDESKPYHLRDTGRYAHDRSYIEKLITKHGFKVFVFEDGFVRQNNHVPLDGYYIVLQKQ